MAYNLTKYYLLRIQKLESNYNWLHGGQSQIVDASHLLVFANITKIDEAYIDAFLIIQLPLEI